MENSLLKIVARKNPQHFLSKSFFEELANKKIDDIHNLSKQIHLNNLVYIFKSKTGT